MNPTPTDPREERPEINTHARLFDLVRYQRSELLHAGLITEEEYGWLCYGSDMAKSPKGGSPSRQRLEDYDEIRATNSKLAAEVERLKTACEKEFQSVEQLSGENIKLAAEIAELKGEVAAFLQWLRNQQSWEAFWADGFLGEKPVSQAKQNLQAIRKYLETTGHGLRFLAEHDTLRDEIAALKDWKESAMSVMPPYQEIGEALGLTIGQSVHDKILPGIHALRTELKKARQALFQTEKRLDDKLRTALAAKDAAEKRVAEVFAMNDPWPTLDAIEKLIEATAHLRDDHSCDTLGHEEFWIALEKMQERMPKLRATFTALTPAPTQELPAGGVIESKNDYPGVELGSAIINVDTGELVRPADVPSEGRGECVHGIKMTQVCEKCSRFLHFHNRGRGECPMCRNTRFIGISPGVDEPCRVCAFNLSDALAGKPVVQRDGRPVTEITTDNQLYPVRGIVDGKVRRWTTTGEYYYGDSNAEARDLFMLPTEGSGA